MFMAPPFLAYYAVDTNNHSLLDLTVTQCGLYRQVLHANTTASYKGLWEHIIGPQSQDTGLWATGNGWAAYGMARVLATVLKAPATISPPSFQASSFSSLTTLIKEILDGAIGAPRDGGLLRNYLNDTTGDGHGYGETSGSTLLAAAAYRVAVIAPQVFDEKYLAFADGILEILATNDAAGNPHVTADGIVTPAIDPLNWGSTVPYTAGSPEGENFVLLMYAAWRDCIDAGICQL